jgi:NADH-quinone oxidoreductase subunit G
VSEAVAPDVVTLTIDGRAVTVPKGTVIIRAAEQLGIEIPRFCEHPFLSPIGACRQCYVEIEGQRKLFTSCTTEVAPDQVVRTQNASEVVREAQVANLEFLLLNHPLDCPICDRGGECPLQDQAMAFGPGESRYTEPKRVFEKPIPLSPLINLDRERCVLCTRCTRFCDEISGDRFLELFARGAGERVAIAAGEDFLSPFSGNTVQICPVGALTGETFRFAARPFDLSVAESVCGHCASGCNVRLDVRRGEIVRVLARDNVEVNDAWVCDKGRYAFRHPDLDTRVTTPLIRDRGLEPASFGEVLADVATHARGKRVAFLVGGRLLDEDAYVLSKLARTVFGTNDLDHRRTFHGGHAEELAAASPLATTYEDVERAKVVVLAGLDAEQELPILHLRIRKAARRGAKVFVIHPRTTRLSDLAEHELCRPEHQTYVLERILDGEEAEGAFSTRVGEALREAGADAVVIAGERLAEHPLAADVALRVAQRFGARFAFATRRANDRGALRAGVHPTLLPGGRRLDDVTALAEVEAVWGTVPATPGRSARAILDACVEREVDVLFLVGVDPLRDIPDADLARRGLANVGYKVVLGLELGALEPYADAFLPACAWAEREGHVTDWEGRSQAIRPVRSPAGVSRPDWVILVELAGAMGIDLGFASLEAIRAEAAGFLAPRPGGAPRSTAWTGTGRPQHVGELTLFSYPLLVDEGRLVEGAAELKAALESEPFAELHPDDADKRGVVDGARVRVRTARGEAVLPARVTRDVAPGALFVPFNQPGFAANTLLDGSFAEGATAEPAGEGGAEPAGGDGAEPAGGDGAEPADATPVAAAEGAA